MESNINKDNILNNEDKNIFAKICEIQKLVKKESSLKEICKKYA
jgi:hypothetical protein